MAKKKAAPKRHARINTGAELRKVAIDVARFVERLFREPGAGADKRAFAVGLINGAVDLPFLTEKDEEKAIGEALDAAVRWLNRGGARWRG